MDYFNILNLQQEPFSNSPDPRFFYQTRQHLDCLQQLELAIRLRRGLNVVIGPVGTGKTTLCRELIRRLADDDHIRTYLMLDPHVSSEEAFLGTLVAIFRGEDTADIPHGQTPKEIIKQFLFNEGVEAQRTVVLIIDEGQKIRPSCLEILRELLNFETNAFKLLQIVIFAQQEFEAQMHAQPNFADRINLRLRLHPLGFLESCALIRHRLQISGAPPGAVVFFSWPALAMIYLQTKGYPRRIIHLCHRCLLTMIVQNRQRAGWRLVRACGQRLSFRRPSRRRRLAGFAIAAMCVVSLLAWWQIPGQHPGFDSAHRSLPAAASEPTTASIRLGTAAPAPAPIATRRSEPPHASPSVAPTGGDDASPLPPDDWRQNASPNDSAAADLTAAAKLPLLLGDLRVAPNETLGDLIRMLYGRFTPNLLERVAQVNPQLHDPDTIEVGAQISFPALPVDIKAIPVDIWWLQLGEYNDLASAMAQRRRLTQEALPVELIAHWNASEGLRFTLVLRELFYSLDTAQIEAQRLPARLQLAGQPCELWQPHRVFFRNPFIFSREARHAPQTSKRWRPAQAQSRSNRQQPFAVRAASLPRIAPIAGGISRGEEYRARA